MIEVVDDTHNLSYFQQWVLFYFLRDKTTNASVEILADNMCLTATLDFEIDRIEPDLKKLESLRLIDKVADQPLAFHSNLKGRFYVKQNILAPLIRIKAQNKITGLIGYLKQNNQNQDLVNELGNALMAPNQGQFLEKISQIALNKIVPFMNMLDVVSTYSPSPTT